MFVKHLKVLRITRSLCTHRDQTNAFCIVSTHKRSDNSNASPSFSFRKVFHNLCEVHDLPFLIQFSPKSRKINLYAYLVTRIKFCCSICFPFRDMMVRRFHIHTYIYRPISKINFFFTQRTYIRENSISKFLPEYNISITYSNQVMEIKIL